MLIFLLSLMSEENRSKIDEIYKKYHDIMYKVVCWKLQSRHDAESIAEEAVQNAFIRVIEYFEKVSSIKDEAELKAYLNVIAIHEAFRIVKKEELLPLDAFCDEFYDKMISDEDFLEKLCIQEDYERVKRAILGLNGRYKAVLFQYFVQEMSGQEIAELLDIKVSTVHTIIWRGKAKLLKILKEDDLNVTKK